MSKGAGITFWEYYATIAGVVCIGPVAKLNRIIQDGKVVWTGPLSRPVSGDYSTITIDAKRSLRFYWGRDTQAADSLLNANTEGHVHPSYAGICYVVLNDYLLGRERTSAPALEFEVEREPVQSVVTGTVMDDGQASPVAAVAEILTHPRHGLGLTGALDTAAWQAAQDASHANRDDEYVSPVATTQAAARGVLSGIASIADLWLRMDGSTLALGRWPVRTADITPGALPLWTADHLTEPPKVTAEGWGTVETGWAVVFRDRERDFKESSEKWDDARAFRVVGEHKRTTVQRPEVTRRTQARRHGLRRARTAALPALRADVVVRRGIGLTVRPGALVRLDIEPEPGGLQVQQVFRVLERRVPPRGPIAFTLEAERSLAPTAYTPAADLPPDPIAPTADDVVEARLLELPPAFADGQTGRVAALVERPNALVIGAEVHFDEDTGGDYLRIGNVEDFALRGEVDTACDDDDTTIRAELTTTLDRHLLDDDPGALAAAGDALVLVLITPAVGGEIENDAGGFPKAELCSISAVSLVSAGVYDLTVLRGRGGSKRRAFAAGAEAWVALRSALRPFYHPRFAPVKAAADTLFFRFPTLTAWGKQALADAPTWEFTFAAALPFAPVITITTPASDPTTYGTAPTSVSIAGSASDADGNLTGLVIAYRKGTDPWTTAQARTFANAATATIAATLPINAAGTWQVLITATDSEGLQTEKLLTFDVAAPAGTVATPAISPSYYSGSSIPSVSITCATSGATIYYTTTGHSDPAPSGPVTGWTTYSGAFTPASFGRVYAAAVKAGMTDSAWSVAELYYSHPPGGEPPPASAMD